MVKIKLIFLFAICCFVFITTNKGYSVSSSDFLTLGSGAKPTSLGNAFVGLADDVNSVYWNPAGLGIVQQRQLSATYIHWFEDVTGINVAYTHPLKKQDAIGLGITYLGISGVTKYEGGVNKGEMKISNIAAGVSYGKEIKPNLLVGGTIKGIQQTLGDHSGNGFCIDGGILKRMPERKVVLGATLKNLGPGITFHEAKESLPMTIKAGVAYFYSDNITFVADINKAKATDISYHLGAEYAYQKKYAIRAGYNSGPYKGGGITLGVGFKQDKFAIDYAYLPISDLGITHWITVSLNFEAIITPRVERPVEKPAAIVPTPSRLCSICGKSLTFIK